MTSCLVRHYYHFNGAWSLCEQRKWRLTVAHYYNIGLRNFLRFYSLSPAFFLPLIPHWMVWTSSPLVSWVRLQALHALLGYCIGTNNSVHIVAVEIVPILLIKSRINVYWVMCVVFFCYYGFCKAFFSEITVRTRIAHLCRFWNARDRKQFKSSRDVLIFWF